MVTARFSTLKARLKAGAPKKELKKRAREVKKLEAKAKELKNEACSLSYESRKIALEAQHISLKAHREMKGFVKSEAVRQRVHSAEKHAEKSIAQLARSIKNGTAECPAS